MSDLDELELDVSSIKTDASGARTAIDRIHDETKNLWQKINHVDNKINWLIGIGLVIAVILLANTIHHW